VGVENVVRPRHGTLLFLTGGPGQPGVSLIPRVRSRLGPALDGYRLVMFDQRGTGAGALRCPRLQAAAGGSDLTPVPPATVAGCAREIGPARRYFSTPETVVDIEALRVALGAGRLTVDGVSYGSYVAERYALTYPRRVARLVLDSVVPQQGVDPLYLAAIQATARVLRDACAQQRCRWDPAADVRAVVEAEHNGPQLLNALVAESVAVPSFLEVLGPLHDAAAGHPQALDRFLAAIPTYESASADWVRPRDAWFHDRADFQPLEQVGAIMASIALDAEVGAQAGDVDELFGRLEESGRLARIDPSQPATMYRSTMLSARELQALRQIEDVVRLGRALLVEADRIVLEQGEVETSQDVLHVDCTACGLRDAPAVPIFGSGRIALQQVRDTSPTFNAALTAFVESHLDDDADKNRLCPPNPYPTTVGERPGMMSRTWRAERRWRNVPDLQAWVWRSRLNLLHGLPDHAAEPAVQAAIKRYQAHVDTAIERLEQFSGTERSSTVSAV